MRAEFVETVQMGGNMSGSGRSSLFSKWRWHQVLVEDGLKHASGCLTFLLSACCESINQQRSCQTRLRLHANDQNLQHRVSNSFFLLHLLLACCTSDSALIPAGVWQHLVPSCTLSRSCKSGRMLDTERGKQRQVHFQNKSHRDSDSTRLICCEKHKY